MDLTVEAIRSRVLADIDRLGRIFVNDPVRREQVESIQKDFLIHAFTATTPEEIKDKIRSYCIDNRLSTLLNVLKLETEGQQGGHGTGVGKTHSTSLSAPAGPAPSFYVADGAAASSPAAKPMSISEIKSTINTLASYNETSLNTKCLHCGGEMIILPNDSCVRCSQCTLEIDTFGSISMANRQTNNGRVSVGGSRSNEYRSIFERCMREITGEITCDLDQAFAEKLRKLIESNRRPFVTCREMRIYLKQLGATKYNSKIPYLIKTFTNSPAVKFSMEEQHFLQIYFICICVIIDEIKKDVLPDRKNSIYRYFIFYKAALACIIDAEKIAIIESLISFPNMTTLIRYDKMMKDVCARMKERGLNLEYKPTPIYLCP